MIGRISSFQSMGAVDGPGLRCVVFMQGCPLRCAYCHNPETWEIGGGQEVSVDELVQKICRYEKYIMKTGGVTVSGGEALLQRKFVAELFEKLQELGYHTALDTSGISSLPCDAIGDDDLRSLLKHTNLVICDIKFTNHEDFKNYCGGELRQVYEFLNLTEVMNIPLWIRQVIVPGVNDKAEQVTELARRAYSYSNLEKIELLPFRKLCVSKYENLKIKFRLEDVPECDKETIDELNGILAQFSSAHSMK